ncbi:MAG: tRNA guanosine(34) transglycosylase Tgt [Polyangiales bacterium]
MSHDGPLHFAVQHQDGHARAGRLRLGHVEVATPAFMPVGTQATVKGLTPAEVEATGARLILANTYHLWLRPGPERIARLGGVKRFMDWPHALLTDSGGFQVFSLADLRDLDDDGVTFRSHLDGRRMRLTPEEAMRVQAALGSDIAMVLDECPPAGASREHIARATERSLRWAERCLACPKPPGQARFVINQGGTHLELRLAHLDALRALPCDGFALGGFSVGEPPPQMYACLAGLAPYLPKAPPRYLMGVGKPADLLQAIAAGIDMFDCVLPTRNGRNGQALTWQGPLNLRGACFKEDDAPLDARCNCLTCRRFSRAYLHHLVRAKEMLACRLISGHNLHFYADLMAEARRAIAAGGYGGWMEETLRGLGQNDGPPLSPGQPRHPLCQDGDLSAETLP